MPYNNFLHSERPDRDLMSVGYEGIQAKYYERDGIHFVINRYQGAEVSKLTTDRYVTISLGNRPERDFVRNEGEQANGLRHFSEHTIFRLLQKLYINNPEAERLIDAFPELHLRGVEIHAATSLQSMNIEAHLPHNEDFAKSLLFAKHILQGNLLINLEEITEAMKEEAPRIENEILIANSNQAIQSFIARHIYTADSISNSPKNLGTIHNLKIATPEDVATTIQYITMNTPAIISIHNPPEGFTDEDIINEVIPDMGVPREKLTPEKLTRINEYLHKHGWVHLEHMFLPSNGKVETTISIPLPDLSPKEIAAWRILADIILSGPTSPRVENLHYRLPSKLYSSEIQLITVSSDVQIQANVEAEKVSQFLTDVMTFFEAPSLMELVTSVDPRTGGTVFEIFKQRRMSKIANTYQDIDSLTETFLREGRYVPPSEMINRLNNVTLEDVTLLLEKIQQNLSQASMLTLSGIAQERVDNALGEQLAKIDPIIPIQKIVHGTTQEERIITREELTR